MKMREGATREYHSDIDERTELRDRYYYCGRQILFFA